MSILLHIWSEKGDPAGQSLPLDPSSVATIWRRVSARSVGVLHTEFERPRRPTKWEARHGVLFATTGAMAVVSFRGLFDRLPDDLDSDLHVLVAAGKVARPAQGDAPVMRQSAHLRKASEALLRSAARSIEGDVRREPVPKARDARSPAPKTASPVNDPMLKGRDWSRMPDVPLSSLVPSGMVARLRRAGVLTVAAFAAMQSSRLHAFTPNARAMLPVIRARADALFDRLSGEAAAFAGDTVAPPVTRPAPFGLADPLAEAVRNDLGRIDPRVARVFAGMIGLGRPAETSQVVARTTGELVGRIRIVMAEAREAFQASSGWPDVVARRVADLVPVTGERLLAEPWARGLTGEEAERLARFALGPHFHCVDARGSRWITPFTNQRWGGLLDGARHRMRAAPAGASRADLARLATAPLGPAARTHADLFLSSLPLPPESVPIWREAACGTLTTRQIHAWLRAQSATAPNHARLSAMLAVVMTRVPKATELSKIQRSAWPKTASAGPQRMTSKASIFERQPSYDYVEPPLPDAGALGALASMCAAIAADSGAVGLSLAEITRALGAAGFTEGNGMSQGLILQGLAASGQLVCGPDGRWRPNSAVP